MPKSFAQALRLGVSNGELALLKTSRLFGPRETVLAELAFEGGAAALGPALRRLFEQAAPAGWPLTVVLSDELVRLWQVTPPRAASQMADLEAAAALRFRALFGAPPASWKISADWNLANPFLAAAVPQTLLALLEQASHEHGLHLVGIVPQFVAALNEWRKARRQGAWFGLVQGGVLTLAAYDGAALVAVRAAVFPVGAGRDWLDAHVAREALRLGLECPEHVQLCGPAPTAWASDASRPGFACALLDGDTLAGWSALARLARTGSRA
jgi:hypothetical protein